MTNKTKQYKLLTMSAILLITSAVNYCNAEIENQRTSIAQFDLGSEGVTGLNVQELMDAQSQTTKMPQPYLSPSFSGRYTRVTRDCEYFEFGPNSQLMSSPVFMESRFYEEVCHTVGGHTGGGHSGGNHGPQTYCEERLVHTERRSVRMEVMNRGQILPWEKDMFQVCLYGQDFRVNTMGNTSHTYDFSVNGHYDLTVTARAGAKIPTLPDPNGVFVEGFVYEPGSHNFRLSFQDRWAGYYDGERTGISLKLKKDRRLWGDEQILSKEMLLPAQERYEVDFASFAGEFSKPLESGQKYYVEWSFRRMGKVSKPINNEGGQTSRITLP